MSVDAHEANADEWTALESERYDHSECENKLGLLREKHEALIAAAKAVVAQKRMLGSSQLAEVMGAHQHDAVALLAEEKDENGKLNGWGEIFLCTDCWCSDVNLAVIAERRADHDDENESKPVK